MSRRRSDAACRAFFRAGVSVIALCGAGSAIAARDGAASSQTSAADQQPQAQQSPSQNPGTAKKTALASKDEIVIVGVRKALESAQAVKKNAPTVVDSVTATDIGAFPDQSAAGALERIPGISVNRLQSADDSTHPSGEPTQVLIRGLPFVRTEFNGRDSFSADSARGLQFNDVSPELLSRIDAYKNMTADMIEGGLAGTVDL
ncbi:MAG TPA: TonB-dependent receptor plug domain-containing protein, partial [Sphingomicrobium sp.]|nr:TonB-dependent receptor plug domain-containing protein [Sphingomicrobium sp.]